MQPTDHATGTTGESAVLEFKAVFDPSTPQDWCELIKDVVAMANSGGGTILVGVGDDGVGSGADLAPVLRLDPAVVTDKIHKYTDEQFSDFTIEPGMRDGHSVALIRIGAVRIPMAFTAPGTYAIAAGAQKAAFARGTVYFRHGAKSEPAVPGDLREAIDRELGRIKGFWLDGISRVVAAPAGSTVNILPPEVRLDASPSATPIRLTGDESAPAFQAIQADALYPFRLKELVAVVNERLGSKVVTTHDLVCVRRVHGVDRDQNLSHQAKWSPRKYSNACVDWIVTAHGSDSSFFTKAREALHRQHASGVVHDAD